MEHPDYNSPASLKTLLDSTGMSMQKKFGQNFLINAAARKKIVEPLEISEGSSVWEIGPGLGSMTEELLLQGGNVTAFEIDRGFIRMLKDFFEPYLETGKLRIVEGDVLKTWKNILTKYGKPQFFFGNLPYNIAATLIADTIEQNVRFDKVVVTVQKEVAQRMTALPGTNDYSSFSILCQWAYDIYPLMDLSAGSFWPRPNVDSRVVVMKLKTDFPCCKNKLLFMKMQRALFISRRKNIRNNLTMFLSDAERAVSVLEKAKIDPSVRAESLTVKKLLELSDILNADIL
ncbi:MAG: 16S rRNA (adenine(1518)-N(6)/adenine(1519)-N(6))-dimethyltransferase RsmA [Treponema sp.]|nr:16S rRNA (adenine(1518)-N(6)/adenine(1519)-N(6))-dimethyltransferase RsmA [Treponema sp.]